MIETGYVMIRTHQIYTDLKLQQGLTPKPIPSAQIQALCEALCEAINAEIDKREKLMFEWNTAAHQQLHELAIAAFNA